MRNKTLVINDIIDIKNMYFKSKQQKQLDLKFNYNYFTIISIGRLDFLKQFEKIPGIAKEIKKKTNTKFFWYIIGDGKAYTIINKNIEENDVKDNVILLGSQDNVYKYMIHADLLVHTSRTETFSLVVNDAKILGIPVLINNYGCASEFVRNNQEGFIVPIEQMSSKIVELLNNQEKLNEIKNNLKNIKYDCNAILNKFYNMI